MVTVINDPYGKGKLGSSIGAAFGQGLAEQIPKEVEHYRLSQGLQSLAKQENLSPQQYLANAYSIYGMKPEMAKQFGELARNQQVKNAYSRSGKQPNQNQQNQELQNPNNGISDNPRSNASSNLLEGAYGSEQTIPSNISRREGALSNPPAASENPLSEKFIPTSPWNANRDEQAINEAFDRGIAATFPEARAYADRQKELYENAPEKYRQQLDYRKSIDDKTDQLFDKQLQTRLQKEGNETFKDIPGDLQLNIKKVARNAVATGKMTPEQSAEYYTNKAVDLVKDKGQALKIANRDVFDRIIPYKKEEDLKSLMHMATNFEDMGSDEDFYNFLTTDTISEDGRQQGMGLSPGGAAIIQYKRTPKVKNLISKTKISNKNPSQSTRAFADDLLKEMTPKDSFLAIARQMKQQDWNFDEYAFFDYLRENKDRYSANKRLDREVTNGVSDFFPNWRDVGLFPAISKSVVND